MPELTRWVFRGAGLTGWLVSTLCAAQAPLGEPAPTADAPPEASAAPAAASQVPEAAVSAPQAGAPAPPAPASEPSDRAPAPSRPPAPSPALEGPNARASEPAADPTDPELAQFLSNTQDGSAVDQVLEQDTLALYGFADFTFERLWAGGAAGAFYRSASFFIGNLNVYLDARLHEQWRALSEVRFTYLPDGSLDTKTGQLIDTTALDYTDGLSELRVGGVEIERAWLEYSPTPWLSARFGQWLTPYGIWNVDHGSPALIAIQKPYMTSVALFPERQTGIALRGNFNLGPALYVTLQATLSNGRGSVDEYRDLDDNKGVGGRAELQYLGQARVQLGASAYAGRYTQAQTRTSIDDGEVSFRLEPRVQYDELSLAGDFRLKWQGFELLSEVAMNEVAFVPGRRPGGVRGFLTTPQADTRRWGVYAIVGYTIAPVWLMPYLGVDHIEDHLTTGEYNLYRAGLRFTPIPSVTIKGEYTHAVPVVTLTSGDTIKALRFQVAWAFR